MGFHKVEYNKKKTFVNKEIESYVVDGMEKTIAGIDLDDIWELEDKDEIIQANDCSCNNEEHKRSCQIVNLLINVLQNKHQKKYCVETCFCNECEAYYIPQSSCEFLRRKGDIQHTIKGETILLKIQKSGPDYDEEKEKLNHIMKPLKDEYNSLTPSISRYAVGGEDVQYEKYLNRGNFDRQEQLKKKMDCPYIGRIDLAIGKGNAKSYYIGRCDEMIGKEYIYSIWSEIGSLFRSTNEPEGVADGTKYKAKLRRKINIERGRLRSVQNTFSSNTELAQKGIFDPFLQQVLLERKKSHKLTDIIMSIQDNQNDIIKRVFTSNIIVQGCAGSGKTMVLLHRLASIIYNYGIDASKIRILTPNDNFNAHISGLHASLELGAVEILSVEKYYIKLLDKYDKQFSYDKKPEEEESLNERYVNYIYGKKFMKTLVKEAECFLEEFLNENDVKIIQEYYEICDKETRSIDMTSYASRCESIKTAVNILFNEVKYQKDKITKTDEEITRLKNNLEFEESEIVRIKEELISFEMEETSRIFVIVSDRLRMAKKDVEIAKDEDCEKREKTLKRWERFYKNIEGKDKTEIIASYVTKELIKESAQLEAWIDKYTTLKQQVNNFSLRIKNTQKAISKKEQERIGIVDYLTDEEFAEIKKLHKKYVVNLPLNIFTKVFADTINDKLYELEIDSIPDKVCRCDLYARLIFAKVFWNKTVAEDELICVDEGQDVSFLEYVLIKEQNDNHKSYVTHFNIYGDTNQLIKHGRGMSDWEHLKQKFFVYDQDMYFLNENYRNTNQITSFCNDIFGFNMTLTGVDGDEVRKIYRKEMYKEMYDEAVKVERTAIIIPRSIRKNVITGSKELDKDFRQSIFSTKYESGKIAVMYVDEVKGVEFDRVYVLDQGMERNERYIAFTRALDKLIIVQD